MSFIGHMLELHTVQSNICTTTEISEMAML